jgi:predicted nucleotidyltransferase
MSVQVRGGCARSRLARLLADRARKRRRRALALARRTLGALRNAGVSACVFGSLAKGRFHTRSDVDYLIEDRGGVSESRILAIVEAAMRAFPFDVTFAERADPRLLAMMREEAHLVPAFERDYRRFVESMLEERPAGARKRAKNS